MTRGDPVSKYLTLAQAAELLGVHTRTIRRRIADGQLRAYRLGPRLVKVAAADVEALLTPIPTA
jgi:excisionase family DNA binding protein